ncbi:MAG: DUF1805 domain-containing protein [Euryarchaeota archaeon]|nr:DUF1805 domain-containing protein [Euryarchaeota archaeon]
MIEVKPIELKNGVVTGIKIDLPKAPLILIFGKKGFVMCGYLNIQTAEKFEIAAALVTGVLNFEDVLEAQIKSASSEAKKLGIIEGISGREALERLI